MSAQRPPRPTGVRPPPPRPGSSASGSAAGGSSRPGSVPGSGRPPLRPPPAPPGQMRRSTPGEARSLLSSRSPSVRPPPGAAPRGASLGSRPIRPPPRRIQIKEDPDGPAAGSPSVSPSASPGPSNFRNGRPRPPRPPRSGPVMTASGPFARGNEMPGGRGAARATASSISSIGASRPTSSPAPSAGGIGGPAGRAQQQSKREPSERRNLGASSDADLEYREEYSDPEEDGYEIIDEYDVSSLDAFAPRSLPRERIERNRRQKDAVKKEDPLDGDTPMASPAPADGSEQKTSDALDLDASEDEEVMDDLLEYFVDQQDEGKEDPENKLLLFQFPPVFPRFAKPETTSASGSATGAGADVDGDTERRIKARRSVAFAEDTVGGPGNAGESPRTTPGPSAAAREETRPTVKKRRSSASSNDSRPDVSSAEDSPRKSSRAPSTSARSSSSRSTTHEGQIGRLDVFRDGRVLFRFGTDLHLVMDVTGGSQTSFLQHAVHMDESAQRATTLGEVHRKFVVAPEIASMLADALDSAGTDGEALRRDPEGMERLPSRPGV